LLDVLSKRPDFHTFPFLGTYFLRCNTTRPPFNDASRAQGAGADHRQAPVGGKILRGGEPVADHLVPDGTANYEPAAGLGYDPELARRLLAEAGYPGGQGFPHFSYLFDSASGGGKIHEKIAVELQQMWRSNWASTSN
jgi:oligopeptide transport system substrate-binding protein